MKPASPKTEIEKIFVDLVSLTSKLGGDRKKLGRCLEIFKTDARQTLYRLKAGLLNVESREIKMSCHGLRGILLTMEMKQAAATAAKLETSIIEKRFDDSRNLLPLLEQEIKIAIDLIQASLGAD